MEVSMVKLTAWNLQGQISMLRKTRHATVYLYREVGLPKRKSFFLATLEPPNETLEVLLVFNH